MPDVSRSGSALIQPSGYALNDYELASFTVTNGTASRNVTQVGGASGYAEGTTVGTITGNAIVFRNSGGTMTTIQAGGTALPVTQDTLVAGEDLTNNRLMTRPTYSYSAVAVADVQVKASAGYLHTVTISCNDAAPTAGSIIIFDNTAESGTQVFNHTFTTTPFVPFSVVLDYTMATGIYIGFTTTADVNVSCAYL